MVSAETPFEIMRVPQIYLRFVWVIKSPGVIHSVLYWDFFYWLKLLYVLSLNAIWR